MSKALVSLKKTKLVEDPTKSSLHKKKPVTKSGHTPGEAAAKLYGGLSSRPPVSTKNAPSKQAKQTVTKQVQPTATFATGKR